MADDHDDLAILCREGTRTALHHALTVAMTALAAGGRVDLALFYEALHGWVGAFHGHTPGFGRGAAAAALERGFTRRRVPSIPELAAQCREVGGERFRVVACGGSVDVLDLEVEDLVTGGVVDDVVGLPTIWRWARGRRVLAG